MVESKLICACKSVTLVRLEHEDFWLMSKNLMVAHVIGTARSPSVHGGHIMTQIYYELNPFQLISHY